MGPEIPPAYTLSLNQKHFTQSDNVLVLHCNFIFFCEWAIRFLVGVKPENLKILNKKYIFNIILNNVCFKTCFWLRSITLKLTLLSPFYFHWQNMDTLCPDCCISFKSWIIKWLKANATTQKSHKTKSNQKQNEQQKKQHEIQYI